MRIGTRRRRGVAAGIVLVGAAAGAISLASADSSGLALGPWAQVPGAVGPGEPEAAAAAPAAAKTTVVIEDGQHSQDAFVDTPPKRRINAGDQFIFETPVLSADGSR